MVTVLHMPGFVPGVLIGFAIGWTVLLIIVLTVWR